MRANILWSTLLYTQAWASHWCELNTDTELVVEIGSFVSVPIKCFDDQMLDSKVAFDIICSKNRFMNTNAQTGQNGDKDFETNVRIPKDDIMVPPKMGNRVLKCTIKPIAFADAEERSFDLRIIAKKEPRLP